MDPVVIVTELLAAAVSYSWRRGGGGKLAKIITQHRDNINVCGVVEHA